MPEDTQLVKYQADVDQIPHPWILKATGPGSLLLGLPQDAIVFHDYDSDRFLLRFDEMDRDMRIEYDPVTQSFVLARPGDSNIPEWSQVVFDSDQNSPFGPPTITMRAAAQGSSCVRKKRVEAPSASTEQDFVGEDGRGLPPGALALVCIRLGVAYD